jgi:hypothetical protein
VVKIRLTDTSVNISESLSSPAADLVTQFNVTSFARFLSYLTCMILGVFTGLHTPLGSGPVRTLLAARTCPVGDGLVP